jgi:general stress protein 26
MVLKGGGSPEQKAIRGGFLLGSISNNVGDVTMDHDGEDLLWNIIKQIGVCMVTTKAHNQLRARPMHAKPDREEGCVWFITDTKGTKDDEITADPNVCLAFADPKSGSYASISGRGQVVRDVPKIRQLWDGEAAAWWPEGPDDDSVCLLRVEPERGEFWDRPANSLVVGFMLAAARATGKPPSLGESRKVTLTEAPG